MRRIASSAKEGEAEEDDSEDDVEENESRGCRPMEEKEASSEQRTESKHMIQQKRSINMQPLRYSISPKKRGRKKERGRDGGGCREAFTNACRLDVFFFPATTFRLTHESDDGAHSQPHKHRIEGMTTWTIRR